jgi:hypothetical protein
MRHFDLINQKIASDCDIAPCLPESRTTESHNEADRCGFRGGRDHLAFRRRVGGTRQ